jgi:hypothetical protein
MGIENNQFFLSHGGFVEGHTVFGEKFTRLQTGRCRPMCAICFASRKVNLRRARSIQEY